MSERGRAMGAKTLAWIPTLRVRTLAYSLFICTGRPSCALSLLDLWDRPWSSNAKRYVYHVLARAAQHGLDVAEHESLV